MISKKIRQSARGENCTLRLPGCRNEIETVVLCHAPGIRMRGIGQKVPDLFGMYGCYHCHQIMDGQKKGEWEYRDVLRAMCETQMLLIEKGLVTVK